MTIRELTDGFTHFVEDRTARPDIGTVIPRKLVYHYMNMHKNLLIKELDFLDEFNFNKTMSLTLPCIMLERVSVADNCPCAPQDGCVWLKTVDPLPGMAGGVPIAVNSVDGRKEYDYIIWSDYKYKLNSRMPGAAKNNYYTTLTVEDKMHVYIHITEDSMPKAVAVTLIPNDILDVMEYPDCEGNKKDICDPLDFDMPIDPTIIPIMHERTLQTVRAEIINKHEEIATPDKQ